MSRHDYPQCERRRPLPRSRWAALCLLTAALLITPAAALASDLDGITATRDASGHTVYVNAERTSDQSATPAPARRTSVLVYWSAREKRWLPLPPPSTPLMRAARTAAADAAQSLESGAGRMPRPASGPQASAAEIEQAIAAAAARHGVDVNLVRAVIKVESNFNPLAVSSKGAMGLMQLMPTTARSLNVANPFDPRQNVDAGVRHLKDLLTSFGGDLRLSLAAYNAGAGAVARANGVPGFSETRSYVQRITDLYQTGAVATPGAWPGSSPISPAVHIFRNENGILTFTSD